MANYDLFIFHGHDEGDNGASGNGYTELAEVKVLKNKVINHLTNNGLNVHTNNGQNNYHRNLTKGNTYNFKMGYTIHINSGGGIGTEIITPRNESELGLDFNILKRFEKLGFKSRGVKGRCYDTEQFFIRENGVKNIGKDWYKEIREAWQNGVSLGIIECCFIDNANDMKLFNSKIDDIAYAISEEILSYCGKTIKPPVTPPINNDKLYKVQVGAFADKKNAEKLAYELKQKGYNTYITF